MPIHISNLAYYDGVSKKGVKLGIKFNNKQQKVRVIRSSEKEV